jgi:hypothetical protein
MRATTSHQILPSLHLLSIEETIQDVVCAALETNHAEVDARTDLEMFAALRHEFPEATMVTLVVEPLFEERNCKRHFRAATRRAAHRGVDIPPGMGVGEAAGVSR